MFGCQCRGPLRVNLKLKIQYFIDCQVTAAIVGVPRSPSPTPCQSRWLRVPPGGHCQWSVNAGGTALPGAQAGAHVLVPSAYYCSPAEQARATGILIELRFLRWCPWAGQVTVVTRRPSARAEASGATASGSPGSQPERAGCHCQQYQWAASAR